MKEACNIKNSLDYQIGYSDGFKEGMNKALEHFIKIEQRVVKPIQVIVTSEDFKALEKKISNE